MHCVSTLHGQTHTYLCHSCIAHHNAAATARMIQTMATQRTAAAAATMISTLATANYVSSCQQQQEHQPREETTESTALTLKTVTPNSLLVSVDTVQQLLQDNTLQSFKNIQHSASSSIQDTKLQFIVTARLLDLLYRSV